MRFIPIVTQNIKKRKPPLRLKLSTKQMRSFLILNERLNMTHSDPRIESLLSIRLLGDPTKQGLKLHYGAKTNRSAITITISPNPKLKQIMVHRPQRQGEIAGPLTPLHDVQRLLDRMRERRLVRAITAPVLERT